MKYNSDFGVIFEVQRATAEIPFYGDRPDDEGCLESK